MNNEIDCNHMPRLRNDNEMGMAYGIEFCVNCGEKIKRNKLTGMESMDFKEWSLVVTPKSQPKSWNGEGLPPVGTKCGIRLHKPNTPESCKILGIFEDKAWVLLFDGNCTIDIKIKDWSFEPLDTRTNEEKAIDDITKFYDNYSGDKSGWTEKNLIDHIKAGKIHNVTWSNNNE